MVVDFMNFDIHSLAEFLSHNHVKRNVMGPIFAKYKLVSLSSNPNSHIIIDNNKIAQMPYGEVIFHKLLDYKTLKTTNVFLAGHTPPKIKFGTPDMTIHYLTIEQFKMHYITQSQYASKFRDNHTTNCHLEYTKSYLETVDLYYYLKLKSMVLIKLKITVVNDAIIQKTVCYGGELLQSHNCMLMVNPTIPIVKSIVNNDDPTPLNHLTAIATTYYPSYKFIDKGKGHEEKEKAKDKISSHKSPIIIVMATKLNPKIKTQNFKNPKIFRFDEHKIQEPKFKLYHCILKPKACKHKIIKVRKLRCLRPKRPPDFELNWFLIRPKRPPDCFKFIKSILDSLKWLSFFKQTGLPPDLLI